MRNASVLTSSDSRAESVSAPSLAFELPSSARATRVGGHRGDGQPLRGTWRPTFFQPAPGLTRAAPPAPRWWQTLLQRSGVLPSDAAIPPSAPPQQPTEASAAEIDPPAAKVFRFPAALDADPAASFWDENRLSEGESVQVYAPAETGFVPTPQPRVGRSFLGAYRKGAAPPKPGCSPNTALNSRAHERYV